MERFSQRAREAGNNDGQNVIVVSKILVQNLRIFCGLMGSLLHGSANMYMLRIPLVPVLPHRNPSWDASASSAAGAARLHTDAGASVRATNASSCCKMSSSHCMSLCHGMSLFHGMPSCRLFRGLCPIVDKAVH